jgi:hypothetical protein
MTLLTKPELEGHRAAIIALDLHNEDWATIRLKIEDWAKFKPNFVGNAIDLGVFLLTDISPRLTKNNPFRNRHLSQRTHNGTVSSK